jgi:hypothetical protein
MAHRTLTAKEQNELDSLQGISHDATRDQAISDFWDRIDRTAAPTTTTTTKKAPVSKPAAKTQPTETVEEDKEPEPTVAAPQPNIVDPAKGLVNTAPVDVAGTVIPQGTRLVVVTNPEGSDADKLYYLVGSWTMLGADLAYEIGDTTRFQELFGTQGEAAFASKETLSQDQFDAKPNLIEAGTADQWYGSTESMQTVWEREMRLQGLEDLPEWIKNDEKAKLVIAEGNAQGWSSGRIWGELSKTEGFSERYPSDVFGRYIAQGGSIADATAAMVADENAMMSAIRRYIPPGSQVTSEYVIEALRKGWEPNQAAAVLDAAKRFTDNPKALEQANTILAEKGIEPLSEVGYLNLLQGNAPDDVVEAINEWRTATALSESGVEGVDLSLIIDVVSDKSRLLNEEGLRATGRELALSIVQNRSELDQNRLGITTDDLVSAFLGDEIQAETLNKLARFERDRRAASQGMQAEAVVTDKGRVRIAGMSDI